VSRPPAAPAAARVPAARVPATRAPRARALLAALLAAALPAGPPSAAHVVYGRPSLADLVAGADVVARARIERGAAATALGEGGEARPLVTAELLEVFKGDVDPGEVRFAQHGHGVAAFVPGDEVLLFLRAIERSRELAELAATSRVRWVSFQEPGAELSLDEGSSAAFVEAVKGYVAAQAAAEPGAALAAWRELTFRLLRSPEMRLAESALRDLVTRGGQLVTRDSLPAVAPVIDDLAAPIGIRLGVLAELERLGLVDGPPRWAALLESVEPPALVAVVRAAGAHPSAPVNRQLMRLLEAADADVAEAAAIALGVPGNQQAVAPLANALRLGEPRLSMAAIRGLGRIGTPAARAALEAAARDHPDETVRRRARAEVRRLVGSTG
jgi:hypothetical protein